MAKYFIFNLQYIVCHGKNRTPRWRTDLYHSDFCMICTRYSYVVLKLIYSDQWSFLSFGFYSTLKKFTKRIPFFIKNISNLFHILKHSKKRLNNSVYSQLYISLLPSHPPLYSCDGRLYFTLCRMICWK